MGAHRFPSISPSRTPAFVVVAILLVVSALHYGSPRDPAFYALHDIWRRLYYVPIVIGAVTGLLADELHRKEEQAREASRQLAESFERMKESERLGGEPEMQAGTLGELPPDGLDLNALEREIIQRALTLCGGNRSATARYLGITRNTLNYRLEKHGIAD